MQKRCWFADGGGDCGEIQCGAPSLPGGRGWAGNSVIDHLTVDLHTVGLTPFFQVLVLTSWTLSLVYLHSCLRCLFVWMVVCLDNVFCWWYLFNSCFDQFLNYDLLLLIVSFSAGRNIMAPLPYWQVSFPIWKGNICLLLIKASKMNLTPRDYKLAYNRIDVHFPSHSRTLNMLWKKFSGNPNF